MRLTSACVAFFLAAPLGRAEARGFGPGKASLGSAESGWHESLSTQVQVLHEAAFLPRGFLMDVGKAHWRLRMDLAMFAPWMSRERMKIYLYQDRGSYLLGKFNPPSWSNGLTVLDQRSIATFVQETPGKTMEIIRHEMTHVFFESYWAESRKAPPVWLNEGLAMLEEAPDLGRPEDSQWHDAMALLADAPEAALPVMRFIRIRPAEDSAALGMDRAAVTLWYAQAYSMVHFLYRRHTRMQFFRFVKGLRDGKGFAQALWQVYRYRSPEDFEDAWRGWLKLPSTRERFVPRRLTKVSAFERERRGQASRQ